MFKDSIPGLQRIFKTAPDPGKIILVRGAAGSMKSSFVLTLMSHYVKAAGFSGVFLTLEQDANSHTQNLTNLGISIPENLIISDFTRMRKGSMSAEGEPNLIASILDLLLRFQGERGKEFRCFALDSIDILLNLTWMNNNSRTSIFEFFSKLREMNLFSFIVKEIRENCPGSTDAEEEFQADGIIETGMIEKNYKVSRYLQVPKMRSAIHSLEKHLLRAGGEKGFEILEPVKPESGTMG